MVPISLYVTLDIIRVIQAKFIEWDINFFYEPLNTTAIVRNIDVIENLGQIEYIFADKTGTLTENCMEFRVCSIGSKIYGETGKSPNEDLAEANSKAILGNLPKH